MRIAVCGNSPGDAERMRGWIEQYCNLYAVPAVLCCFHRPEAFAGGGERFDAVFMGFGGPAGFLQARALRERDADCRIVLVDDTGDFAVQGMRLHCTDLIIRPVEFRHIVRSMRLVTRRGAR